MWHSLSFKHCLSCEVSSPSNDPQGHCLLCLGEVYKPLKKAAAVLDQEDSAQALLNMLLGKGAV